MRYDNGFFYFGHEEIEGRLAAALSELQHCGLQSFTVIDIVHFELRRIQEVMRHFGFSVELSNECICFKDNASENGETFPIGNLEPVEVALRALADDLHDTTGGEFVPFDTGREESVRQALQGAAVVVSAGPAGVRVLPAALWQGLEHLKTMIDLNAVPPMGIEGIEATDKNHDRSGVMVWGALGVGGTKMKIHKAAIARMFEANDLILDAEEVYALAASF